MAQAWLWRGTTWVLSCLALSGCGDIDWSAAANMPFAASARVELAADGWPWTRSLLSLVCGSDQTLHFVVLTDLPVPLEFLTLERVDDATIYINGTDQKLSSLDMRLVALGPPDTIVSDALSSGAVDQMIEWFGVTTLYEISIVGFEETGIYMRGQAAAIEIDAVVQKCLS